MAGSTADRNAPATPVKQSNSGASICLVFGVSFYGDRVNPISVLQPSASRIVVQTLTGIASEEVEEALKSGAIALAHSSHNVFRFTLSLSGTPPISLNAVKLLTKTRNLSYGFAGLSD